MSSSVIHLTLAVLCRPHLTWRTAAMESIPRKSWNTNTIQSSFLCSFQLPSSPSHLFLLFILYFFFSTYTFIFAFFFIHVYCIKPLITTGGRNCSGGRKIEYKVVIYSHVWGKLRRIWCDPMRCSSNSIRNETLAKASSSGAPVALQACKLKCLQLMLVAQTVVYIMLPQLWLYAVEQICSGLTPSTDR